MTRKELIEKLMNVAENYKKDYLYETGAMTDIGVLVDEYTETVVKNCSIPNVVGQSEQLICDECVDGQKWSPYYAKYVECDCRK